MIKRRWCTRITRLLAMVLVTAVVTIYWHYSTSPVPLDLLGYWGQSTPSSPSPVPPSWESDKNRPVTSVRYDLWNASSVLVGDVIEEGSFKSRLRNDTHYITGWTDGGFTNAVMTYANLIYLGIISNRVPIIPPFVAWHHIDESAGVLEFSDIFDLPALRNALRTHVLEWSDIRKLPVDQDQHEPVGCWSAWAAGNLDEHSPRGTTNRIASYIGLDISYTSVPHSTRRKLDNRWDWGLLFWRLAALIYPSPNGDSLPDGLEAPFSTSKGLTMPPDTQLACFDLLYFVTMDNDDAFEWSDPWNAQWRSIGRYMKFRKRLVLLAQAYLRSAFELPASSVIPPFIAVHVRHGDFGGACGQETRAEDCFAPLSAYAAKVKEVQVELRQKKGIIVPDDYVVVTSDETDPKFWEKVVELGWTYFDHKALGTFRIHGEWYLTLIDIVSASLSIGFVGTDVSTVSTISVKRVQDWNGGVTRIVKWGRNAH